MPELSVLGLINLIKYRYHVEIGKLSDEDRRLRRAPPMTVYYLDRVTDEMRSLTVESEGEK